MIISYFKIELDSGNIIYNHSGTLAQIPSYLFTQQAAFPLTTNARQSISTEKGSRCYKNILELKF